MDALLNNKNSHISKLVSWHTGSTHGEGGTREFTLGDRGSELKHEKIIFKPEFCRGVF